jgi:pimeloyl-ACP methyl ester carboxylesterase
MTGMTLVGTLPWTRAARTLTLLAAVVLAVGACTGEEPGSPDPDVPPAAVADTVPGKAPVPAERCHASGNVPAVKVVLTTSDGTHLAGVRFGSGPRGVLLLPQRDADLCPWWDWATTLVTAGFHVLAIDMRGTGFSEDGPTRDYTIDAMAGIAELKKAGAARVVVMGASQGAATAIVTAGRAPDQVAGVVALSYPDDNLDVTAASGPDPHTPKQAAPLVTAPMLIAFAAGDREADGTDAERLLASSRAADKQLVGRPGVSHGWDMLTVGADDVRPAVRGFLDSYA